MNYAIIRVRLPVVKNLRIKDVYAIAPDEYLNNLKIVHKLYIETVRYIRGKTKPTRKAKAVARARASKRKAVA